MNSGISQSKTFVFLIILLLKIHLFAAINLAKEEQDFILQTKRIKIPGYSDAYNPSITRWKGRLLLSFRARDPLTKSPKLVGLVWLNNDLELDSDPKLLQIEHEKPAKNAIQDARLIVMKDKLYAIYSNIWSSPDSRRRMFIAEVKYDGNNFTAISPQPFLEFEDEIHSRPEKNWVPFIYKDHLLLAYSLLPHKIFLPIFGKQKCETIASTQGLIEWKWGELRGGTQAYQVDNQYLSFFHSSIDLKSKQSDEKKITHYFMGAYTFELEPPFAITQISPSPIICKKFYKGKEYGTWKPMLAIFPCGYVFNNKYIWVTYGRQDHEIWIVKLDKKGLLESLIPVTTVDPNI